MNNELKFHGKMEHTMFLTRPCWVNGLGDIIKNVGPYEEIL